MTQLILLLLAGTSALASSNITKISAGQDTTCAFFNQNQVQCWGHKGAPAITIPVKNVTEMGFGDGALCALNPDGVSCWGSDMWILPEWTTAGIQNQHSLTTMVSISCVLSDGDAYCLSTSGKSYRMPLNHARMIAAAGFYACALNDQGVHCFGTTDYPYPGKDYGQLNPPSVKNAKIITAGYLHSCVLDDNGVQCWGENNDGKTVVPSLKNPRDLASGRYHNCAIDDHGVQCWGDNQYGQSTPPSHLKNPRTLALGAYHSCALDDDGVKCWGQGEDPTDVHTFP